MYSSWNFENVMNEFNLSLGCFDEGLIITYLQTSVTYQRFSWCKKCGIHCLCYSINIMTRSWNGNLIFQEIIFRYLNSSMLRNTFISYFKKIKIIVLFLLKIVSELSDLCHRNHQHSNCLKITEIPFVHAVKFWEEKYKMILGIST